MDSQNKESTNLLDSPEICKESMYLIECTLASSLTEISPETQKYMDELAESAQKYFGDTKLWSEKNSKLKNEKTIVSQTNVEKK